MRALILAAGRGRRMGEHTNSKPKCLTMFRGKPLIEWQINALNKSGINEIGVVTGYKSNLLKKYCLRQFHNKDWFKTQMVSSLECASDWVKQGDIVISYSDIFYEHNAINLLVKSNRDISILYDVNWLNLWSLRFKDPLSDAESFLLNKQNELLEIGEKVNDYSKIKGQYMGLIFFSKNGWETFYNNRLKLSKSEKMIEDMTSAFQRLIRNKIIVHGVKYNGQWGEVDTIDDLIKYEKTPSLFSYFSNKY